MQHTNKSDEQEHPSQSRFVEYPPHITRSNVTPAQALFLFSTQLNPQDCNTYRPIDTTFRDSISRLRVLKYALQFNLSAYLYTCVHLLCGNLQDKHTWIHRWNSCRHDHNCEYQSHTRLHLGTTNYIIDTLLASMAESLPRVQRAEKLQLSFLLQKNIKNFCN